MAELPEAVRDRHAEYLLARQQPDGGFPGRDGGSDLYYTGFALRGLSLLGRLYGPVAERAAGFLHDRFATPKTIVDFLSLIYGAALLDISAGIDVFADQPGDWRQAAVERLQALRRSDGGYAKSPEGHASSTYHSFLVLLCLQLLGSRPSEPERLAGFILSQRTPEGGFREIRAAQRAGTNPTAAAVGGLRALGAWDPQAGGPTTGFLAAMQTEEGGLRANTRIPLADLLSTFTGVLTLCDLQALDAIDAAAAWRYADRLQAAGGGFHGRAGTRRSTSSTPSTAWAAWPCCTEKVSEPF